VTDERNLMKLRAATRARKIVLSMGEEHVSQEEAAQTIAVLIAGYSFGIGRDVEAVLKDLRETALVEILSYMKAGN